MKFTVEPGTFDSYRIWKSGAIHRPHRAHRWHTDRWFRSWQCEWSDALWCPRAWTKKGVERKARRWYRNGLDVRRHERRYGPNAQAREMAVARKTRDRTAA